METIERLPPSIELLNQLFIYNPETGKLVNKINRNSSSRAGREAGFLRKDGYREISIGKKAYLAHRIVWIMETGEWPNKHIDHISGNTTDNRFCNLREATVAENARNSKIYSTNISGSRGVYWANDRKCWRANIKLSGKSICLGSFQNKHEAIAARAESEFKLFGKFSSLLSRND